MKKILFAFLALSVLYANSVNAQSITQDTAFGGQKVYTSKCTIIIPDSTTVRVRNIVGFNLNFSPFNATAWDTLSNSTIVSDTVRITKVVPVSIPGNYFTRWELQTITGGTLMDTSMPMPIVVIDSIKSPKISLDTKTATANGGIQTLNFNAGNDSAKLRVLLSLGDTLCANATLQNSITALIDSGTTTYTFTGYPANYVFSYRFIITNSLGSDTSKIGWIKVLPSNQLWVGQVDSFGVTDKTISCRTQVINNGTNVLRTYIALTGGNPFDSISQTIIGSGGATPAHANFSGLQQLTKYDVWSKFVGTTTIGSKRTIQTDATAISFGISTDSAIGNLSTGKITVYITVTVPSGETARVGILGTTPNDTGYLLPLYASSLQNVSQGIWKFTYEFTVAPGDSTIARGYGYTASDLIYGNSITVSWRAGVITGIKQNKVTEVKIYPNPFMDRINIETSLEENFRVISITGQEIVSGMFHPGQNTVTLNIPPGVYLIQTPSFTQKVVKQ